MQQRPALNVEARRVADVQVDAADVEGVADAEKPPPR